MVIVLAGIVLGVVEGVVSRKRDWGGLVGCRWALLPSALREEEEAEEGRGY